MARTPARDGVFEGPRVAGDGNAVGRRLERAGKLLDEATAHLLQAANASAKARPPGSPFSKLITARVPFA